MLLFWFETKKGFVHNFDFDLLFYQLIFLINAKDLFGLL